MNLNNQELVGLSSKLQGKEIYLFYEIPSTIADLELNGHNSSEESKGEKNKRPFEFGLKFFLIKEAPEIKIIFVSRSWSKQRNQSRVFVSGS